MSQRTNGPRGEHCVHESNYFGSIQGRASIHQGDIRERLRRGEEADELRVRLAVRKERMMEDVKGRMFKKKKRKKGDRHSRKTT